MYETGVNKYIEALLVPNLPKCYKKTQFRSAKLPDLMSAFLLLFIGVFLSIFLMIGECVWFKKQQIVQKIKKKMLLNTNCVKTEVKTTKIEYVN